MQIDIIHLKYHPNIFLHLFWSRFFVVILLVGIFLECVYIFKTVQKFVRCAHSCNFIFIMYTLGNFGSEVFCFTYFLTK